MDTKKMEAEAVMGVFKAFSKGTKKKDYPTVRLTKLDNGESPKYPVGHPRHIEVGRISQGLMLRPVAVGESFYVDYLGMDNHFHTSDVQEILSENTFKTKNSIYKWEIIK